MRSFQMRKLGRQRLGGLLKGIAGEWWCYSLSSLTPESMLSTFSPCSSASTPSLSTQTPLIPNQGLIFIPALREGPSSPPQQVSSSVTANQVPSPSLGSTTAWLPVVPLGWLRPGSQTQRPLCNLPSLSGRMRVGLGSGGGQG